MDRVRTPLTYYGGKQLLAQRIVGLLPPHKVYLEPFAGGAAVLFAKPRAQRETLNDLDGDVINFWSVLRDTPDAFSAAVEATPYSRAEWEACHRERRTGDPLEDARRFLVRIDQSFSRTGESWSPPSVLLDRRGRWQAGVWQNLPDKLRAAATRLSGVALEATDGVAMLERYDTPDAVIYCDPPYTGAHRLEPSKGYAQDDHASVWARLVDALLELRHAMVILSGYPCDDAERLGWRRIDLDRKRTVQERARATLTAAPEAVWLSPTVDHAQGSLLEAATRS